MPENFTQTIFVVDDELVIASTLAMILNSSGFCAVPFTSAKVAIKAAELDCPDLLITDVSMPEMNGVELAIVFRNVFPSCRVFLFSGALATTSLLEEAKQQGYEFQVLAKPIHPKEMLAAIRNL
jgi:DNA-binding NtrC family response regulator